MRLFASFSRCSGRATATTTTRWPQNNSSASIETILAARPPPPSEPKNGGARLRFSRDLLAAGNFGISMPKMSLGAAATSKQPLNVNGRQPRARGTTALDGTRPEESRTGRPATGHQFLFYASLDTAGVSRSFSFWPRPSSMRRTGHTDARDEQHARGPGPPVRRLFHRAASNQFGMFLQLIPRAGGHRDEDE